MEKVYGLKTRKERVGATPKGQRRPVRHYDSWRTPTQFMNGRLLERGFYVPVEHTSVGREYEQVQDEKRSRDTPRCQNRPVRPSAAGGLLRHSKPGSFWKVALAGQWRTKTTGKAQESVQEENGVGATPKGQRRRGRPYDSWRALTPFVSGRLWKVASAVKEAADHWKGGSVGTGGNMELVTLHMVSVAQCDHMTAGGLRRHS